VDHQVHKAADGRLAVEAQASHLGLVVLTARTLLASRRSFQVPHSSESKGCKEHGQYKVVSAIRDRSSSNRSSSLPIAAQIAEAERCIFLLPQVSLFQQGCQPLEEGPTLPNLDPPRTLHCQVCDAPAGVGSVRAFVLGAPQNILLREKIPCVVRVGECQEGSKATQWRQGKQNQKHEKLDAVGCDDRLARELLALDL
jgi:hypothetical protein